MRYTKSELRRLIIQNPEGIIKYIIALQDFREKVNRNTVTIQEDADDTETSGPYL